MAYRHLTEEEISSLKSNGCSAENWQDIFVSPGFSPDTVIRVNFYGVVRLGVFSEKIPLPGGISIPSGIYDATLFNVTVGDSVLIANVHGYIANYEIGSRSYIADVGKIYMEGVSAFGNGLKIHVLNEVCGREVAMYDGMSAQSAYVSAIYRHRAGLRPGLQNMVDTFTASRRSDKGRIGSGVRIENVGIIKNVLIGDYAVLQGCLRLFDGTVSSTKDSPVRIGCGTVCTDFMIQSGSIVEDNVVVTRSFIGQGVVLAKGFTSSDSLFFANSHCENGEAVSVFAGPFSVSHHKSTLLIGSIYSFMNAGSATNFSNHQYKLGPLHQGIFGRGVKFGSGSYMMLPVRVAPFSTVIGHHYGRIDTVDMPFSYILETESGSCLVPGANLTNCGFFRDVRKWPARDRRGIDGKQDCIVYNAFSPLTASAMLRGMRRLAVLRSADRSSKSPVSYGGCLVSQSSIVKGLAKYEAALKFYMGNVIVERIEDAAPVYAENIAEALRPEFSVGSGDWVDMAGLLAPKEEVAAVLDDIENGTLQSLEEMDARFQKIASNYKLYEWCWVYTHINDVFGIDPLTMDKHRLVDLVRQWDRAAGMLYSGIEKDASKEYSADAMTGYGADGTFDEAGSDFLNVRGDYESDFLVQAVRESRQMISDRAHEIILSF